MGHGVSTQAIDTGSLFVDENLILGCKKLLENQSYRGSFVSYVKSGAWVDSLRRWIPVSSRKIPHEERIAFEKDCILYAYKLPKSKLRYFEEILTYDPDKFGIKRVNSKTSITSARTSCSNSWGSPGFQHKLQSFEECYAHMEDCVTFEPSELLSLMFNIIYAQYKVSSEYTYFIKYGRDKRDGDENSSIQSALSHSAEDRLIQTKHSKVAQDILLSCAAFFDESDLLIALEMPNWIDCFPCAIHDHTIGITIIDTSLEYNPIVYANQAFLRRAGFPCDRAALGQNWAFLNGPKTEDDQAAMIDYAIEHNQPLKAAITQYSRNGKTFVNLLALRPVGKYCIGAHFHATKGCDFETLKSVDNLLTLMSYAIKQPPCSSIESPVLSPRYEAPVSVVGVGVVGESPVLSPRYEAPVPVVGVGETVATTPYYNPSARCYSTNSNISNSASSEYTIPSYLHSITAQLHWKDRLTSHVSNIATAVVALCAGQRQYSSNKDNINYHKNDNLVESAATSPSVPILMPVGRGSGEVVQVPERQCLSIRLVGIEGVPEMELLDFE